MRDTLTTMPLKHSWQANEPGFQYRAPILIRALILARRRSGGYLRELDLQPALFDLRLNRGLSDFNVGARSF